MPSHTTTDLTPDEIADLLGETEDGPRQQIAALAAKLGPVAMSTLLDAVLAIEDQGGLLLADGRRRTPGGVLFFVTRCGGNPYPRTPAPAYAPEAIETVLTTIPGDLLKGAATVKMVLTGRPKETIERDGYVVAHMESTAPKNCPRGLPTPPTQGMTWMVLIAERQWRAVTPALRQDKEDRLIVEGQPCQVDGNNILYATSVVTMGQQRAKKEAQRLAAVGKE